MRTDGQTDMTNLIITFHNFSKAPKNKCGAKCEEHLTTNVRTGRWKVKVQRVYSVRIACD
jgi:hypothetical protein